MSDWYAEHWERCAGLKSVFQNLRHRDMPPRIEHGWLPSRRVTQHLAYADMLDVLRYCGDRPQSIKEVTLDV